MATSSNRGYRHSPKDQFYYLQHTDYKYLPLTNFQKTKINSALGSKQATAQYLSPRQEKWLEELRTSRDKAAVIKGLRELSYVE